MKLPVIRGHIGDWRYYTGVMKFKDVADIVTPSVDEFCNPSCLNDLLQRQLTENYKSIAKYLIKEKQRFFNAVVLAIYDGDPKWLEIEFREDYEEYNNVGFLSFDEDIRVFPVDGQHRVKGIIEAIRENQSLIDEEVPVVFIAHKNNIEGKKRTRKLFSTLNRRAKPVGDNYQIALDEDDIVAIVTREIVEEFELFQGERLLNTTKQIPKSNVTAFTSLIALYQCNEALIRNKLEISDKELKEYKLYRPDEDVVDEIFDYVKEYWSSFIYNIPPIKKFVKSVDKPAEEYRNKDGGNLLFRPIGIIEFVKSSVIVAKRQNKDWNYVLKQMSNIQLNLNSQIWKGVVWDGKKIINRVNTNLIRLIIMRLVSEMILTEAENTQLIDLYIAATNFEGDRTEVLDKIVKYT